MNIAIIGAGGWGTALAIVAAESGNTVTLWARSSDRAAAMNATRENSLYLPGIHIPDDVSITADTALLQHNDLYLFAVPSQSLREIAEKLLPYLNNKAIIVTASKGIERHTLKRMTEVLSETLGTHSDNIVALSGPSHAEEVAKKIPTAVLCASKSEETAQKVQQVFLLPTFRLYTSTDVIGVELAGALKNVIAICAGILEGEGFGDNTVAALVTRGIAEMRRLGVALGAEEQTFSGLAGLGDLVVTCLSKHSRNRRVGVEIGKGRKLPEILASMQMVAEGVMTTQSAMELAMKHSIEMPIVEETYKILFEDKDYRDATTDLMTREAKNE